MTITTAYTDLEMPTTRRLSSTTQPVARSRRDDVASVPSALHAEWIKIRSLRSTPGFLALTAVAGVLLSWIVATFVKTDPQTHEVFTIGQTFILSTWLTTVLAVIMGTLLFTSEVQHGTLATAVTAQPARWVTVTGKATLAAGFGLVMGVVGMIAGFGGAVLGGLDAGDTSGITATVLWGLLLTALAPVFGLGVGMIIRHSSAAIPTVLVWALVLENLIRGLAAPTVTRFLPFSAADGLLAIKSATDTPETALVALSRVQDAFLFGGYTVVALAIGTVLLYRRDTN